MSRYGTCDTGTFNCSAEGDNPKKAYVAPGLPQALIFQGHHVSVMHPIPPLITRTSARQSISSSTGPTTTSFPGSPLHFRMTRGDWILVMWSYYYLRAKHQCNMLRSSGFYLVKELLFNIIFLNRQIGSQPQWGGPDSGGYNIHHGLQLATSPILLL